MHCNRNRVLWIATVLALRLPASAAVYTWTGGAPNANWSTKQLVIPNFVTNWGTGLTAIVPPSNVATGIVFNTASGATPNQDLATPFSLNTITFGTAAGPFTLNGGQLQFNAFGGVPGGIIDNSSAAEVVNEAITATSDLTFGGTGSGTATINSVISGPQALNVTGGNFTLSGPSANTFTGMTTVSGGTLNLSKSGGTAAIGGDLTAGGGIVNISGDVLPHAATVTLAGGTVRATGGLTAGRLVINAGTIDAGPMLTLSSTSQYAFVYNIAGPWTATTIHLTGVSGGGLQLTNDVISAPIDLGGAPREINTVGNSTISGTVSNGSIIKTGAQAILMSGADNSLGFFRAVGGLTTFDGGTMSLSATGATGLSGDSSLFVEGTANAAVDIRNGFQLNTVATPSVHNAGAITVEGAGTVWNNTDAPGHPGQIRIGYAGGTSTLTVKNSGNVSTPGLLLGGSIVPANPGVGSLTVNSGGSVVVSGALTLNDGKSSILVDHGTLAAGALLSSGAPTVQISDGSAPALTIGGYTSAWSLTAAVSDAPGGQGSIVKVGSEAVTLTGLNTYTGSTTINAGSIVVGAGSALQNSTVRINTDNGLNLNGLANVALGGLAGTGALALGFTQLSVGGNNASSTYSGNVSGTVQFGSGGSLAKTGAGTLTLANSNSALSQLTVNNGAVIVDNASVQLLSGGGFPPSIQSLYISNGATLMVRNGATFTPFAASVEMGAITVDGPTTTFNLQNQLILGYSDNTTGSLTVQNGATFTHGGGGGILNLGFTTGTVGTLTVNTGGHVGVQNLMLAEGTGSAGTAIFDGANTTLGVSSQLDLGGEPVVLPNNGGTASLTFSNGAAASIGGTTFFGNSASTLNINKGSFSTNVLVVGAGLSPGITLSDPSTTTSALTVGTGNGSSTFPGLISDAPGGPGGITKVGTGSLTLTHDDTFSGPTRINAGSVVLGTDHALLNSTVVINTNGVLDINGMANPLIGGLAGTANLTIDNRTTTLHIGNNNSNTSYSGVLSAPTVNLTQFGTGTSTFTNSASVKALYINQGGVTLDGANVVLSPKAFDNETSMYVFDGTLMLKNGATLNGTTGSSYLNRVSGVSAAILDGAGTTWNSGYQTLVQSASLTVQNGASLSAAGYLIVGFDHSAKATLLVQSGGHVVAGTTLLGSLSGAHGDGTVTGNQSMFSTGSLALGGVDAAQLGGTGAFTVSAGASAVVAADTTFWAPRSSLTIDRATFTTAILADYNGAGGSIFLSDPAPGSPALILAGSAGNSSFSGMIADGPHGPGSVLKNGPLSALTLTSDTSYTGATTATGSATIIIKGANHSTSLNALGASLIFIDGGTLFPGFGSIRPDASSLVQYNNATVNGGFLRGAQWVGPGAAGSRTAFNGSTLMPDAGLAVFQPASFTNVTNHGSISAAAAISCDGFVNGAAGSVLFSGGLTHTLAAFENDGMLNLASGTTVNNTTSDLTSGGGSQIIIAGGGVLNLQNNTRLQLNGALLSNNGTIAGTVNVNYGSLATGAGTTGTLNVNNGGRFSPGNSPGIATSIVGSLGGGGIYAFDINDAAGAAGIGYDQWQLSGVLFINAGNTPNSRFNVEIRSLGTADNPGLAANFNPNRDQSLSFIHAAGGITGFNPANFAVNSSGFTNPTNGGVFAVALDPTGTSLLISYSAPQWNASGGGTWPVGANWIGGAPTVSANFLGKITTAATVTLDGPRTVQGLRFDSPTQSYNIASGAGGTLTLNNGTNPIAIDVLSGSHAISAPLTLMGNTTATISAGADLKISGPVAAAGTALTKAGAGTLELPSLAGVALNLTAGTTAALPGDTLLDPPALTIAPGAVLDLRSGDMVLRYSGNDPYAAYAALLHSGAITTSLLHPSTTTTAEIALVDNILLHITTWHGDTISDGTDFHELLFAYTYAGDVTLDGMVTPDDYINVIANLGRTNATWTTGDLNGDGVVSLADLVIVEANLGAGTGGAFSQPLAAVFGPETSTVPEPGCVSVLTLSGLVLLRRQRRIG